MTHTIASVENEGKHVRTFPTQHGQMYAFKVTLTDGTQAQTNKKSTDPPKPGERFKTLAQPAPNAPEGALPTLKDREYEDGQKGGKSFEADARKLRGENMRSALHAAIAAAERLSDKPTSVDGLIAIADKMYEAIEAKAKVGE